MAKRAKTAIFFDSVTQMSQPLVASSLAVLVDNFMANIADLKIQADLIEGNSIFAIRLQI